MRKTWWALPGVLLGLSCGGATLQTPAAGEMPPGLAGAGQLDGGDVDAGEPDAGEVDAGEADAGEVEGGERDAGQLDAGPPDAGARDAGFVDACSTQTAQCPGTPSSLVEGGGLRAIDRCAFPMSAGAGFRTNGALLDALEQRTAPVTLSHVVADANRVALPTTRVPGSPAGLEWAFEWNAEDQASTAWIPQGITGSADGDPSGLVGGKRIVLVSFYEDAGLAKGVRIAFVDVTNPNAPRYRFALPLFSWVSLDRSSTPPALVSGEYCSSTACSGPLAGRLFRWPLDPTSGLLRDPGTTWPGDAFVMGQRQVQGGAHRAGITHLSSSAPAGGGGALYSVNPTSSRTANFSDSPEDLMVDEAHGVLWSLSEAAGGRAVFAVRFSSYPTP